MLPGHRTQLKGPSQSTVAQERVYSTRKEVSQRFIDGYYEGLTDDDIGWLSRFQNVDVEIQRKNNILLKLLPVNLLSLKSVVKIMRISEILDTH